MDDPLDPLNVLYMTFLRPPLSPPDFQLRLRS